MSIRHLLNVYFTVCREHKFPSGCCNNSGEQRRAWPTAAGNYQVKSACQEAYSDIFLRRLGELDIENKPEGNSHTIWIDRKMSLSDQIQRIVDKAVKGVTTHCSLLAIGAYSFNSCYYSCILSPLSYCTNLRFFKQWPKNNLLLL